MLFSFFDMKFLFTALVSVVLVIPVFAQTEISTDTTVYEFAETLPFPVFKNCVPTSTKTGWNRDSIKHCGEIQLLSLLSSNIRYPAAARDSGIQGTVVLSFVVEPSNGRVSSIGLMKDIGAGCGEEAIRVLSALDSLGLRWEPATKGGKAVRVRHTLPLKFKLQEIPPFEVNTSGDTIYTTLDKEPTFQFGIDSLINYLWYQLKYPSNWADSCKTGVFEMAVQISKTGDISVDNVLDFSNLGLDFQWEAMELVNSMQGMWEPAIYQGNKVNTTLPIRVVFKSDETGCEIANERFDNSMLLANEGSILLENGKTQEAIDKWTEALKMEPNNCELLYYRGTAQLNLSKIEEACQDYDQIKSLLGITWFEQLRIAICGY